MMLILCEVCHVNYCVRYYIIYRIHAQKDRNLAYNTDKEKPQRLLLGGVIIVAAWIENRGKSKERQCCIKHGQVRMGIYLFDA